MKRITLLVLVCLTIIIAGCNKNDDNIAGGTINTDEAIIGTWKLSAVLTDGAETTIGNCDKEETYIFGTEQLTHEVYLSSDDDDDDDDDSDDESDDHSDDSSDDDSDDSSDDDSDDSSDDDSDDDNRSGKVETCTLLTRKLAYWSNEGSNHYKLTFTDVTENHNITFTEANNKFYFEKTVTERGVTKVKRYIFQRQ